VTLLPIKRRWKYIPPPEKAKLDKSNALAQRIIWATFGTTDIVNHKEGTLYGSVARSSDKLGRGTFGNNAADSGMVFESESLADLDGRSIFTVVSIASITSMLDYQGQTEIPYFGATGSGTPYATFSFGTRDATINNGARIFYANSTSEFSRCESGTTDFWKEDGEIHSYAAVVDNGGNDNCDFYRDGELIDSQSFNTNSNRAVYFHTSNTKRIVYHAPNDLQSI